MAISKAKQAQRARRLREQSNSPVTVTLNANPSLRCTVRWADNSTSVIPLSKLLKPSIRDTITSLHQTEPLASDCTAQSLQPRASSTILADLRQANQAKAQLEAELREIKAQNKALATQHDKLKESCEGGIRTVKLLKSKARKDILTVAKLKTQVRQLRSHAHSLDVERKGLKEDLARVSDAVVSWGFQDISAIPLI